MNLNLHGLDKQVVTFKCSSDITSPGQFVKMGGSNSVKLCGSGDEPIGVCLGVRNGYAAVQIRGYVEVKQNGTITVGYNTISAVTDSIIKRDYDSPLRVLVLYALGGVAGILL